MKELKLKSVEFRREREASWRELEDLLRRVERRGLRRLGFRDLMKLPILYRSTLSSLSVARAISLDRNLLQYLEGLTARAYVSVYGVRRRLGEAFALFLARRFPREVRAHGRLLALAAIIFLLGGAAGFVTTLRNPDDFYRMVPENQAQGRGPTSTREELRAILFDEEEHPLSGLGAFASFLFTNNAQIGILCFSLGIALGVPVFYLLFHNGQGLGAMAAIHHQKNLSVDFWGWILPHGITEILAVLICGAAGLVLARSLILPGRGTRLQELAAAGRKAGLMVLGSVCLFLLAAAIEGFMRQLVHDTTIRYITAGTTLLMLLAYFRFVGRRAA
jgi:uncharacterized membrane protein SpoIIM required for sporulation